MSEENLRKMKEALGSDAQHPEAITHLALLQSIAGLNESISGLFIQLDNIKDMAHSIDKRLTTIESGSLSATVADLSLRIRSLEDNDREQAGMAKGMEALRRWAPTLVTVIAGLYVLFKTGVL